jgi:hypothetical protein
MLADKLSGPPPTGYQPIPEGVTLADLRAELRWLQDRCAAALSRDSEDMTPIISLGDRQYQLGERPPIPVSVPEDRILQAFIGQPTMRTAELVKRSRESSAVSILKRLHKRFAKLAPGENLAMRSQAGHKGGQGYFAQVIPTD